MSTGRARVQRLEETFARRGKYLSPAGAWAAVVNGEGDPDLVKDACWPCLAELQRAMLSYGHRALEERRAGVAPPNALPALQVRVLAETVAYAPGEPVPKRLLEYRDPPHFDPAMWHRASRGNADRQFQEFAFRYVRWVVREVTWLIVPDLEARDLRQRLQTGAPSDWAGHDHDDGLSLERWPEGLFQLLTRNF